MITKFTQGLPEAQLIPISYTVNGHCASGEKYPCVNFVIKVHGTSSVPDEFSSYEKCLKTFKEKSFEFNIHIKSTKKNIEDKKTFASVVDTVLTNARARNFEHHVENGILDYFTDKKLKVRRTETFLPKNYKYTVPP